HLEIGVGVTYGPNQQTFIRIAGQNSRRMSPPLHPAHARIEQQAGLHLVSFGAVTALAVVGKNRTNSLFEKGDTFGRSIRRQQAVLAAPDFDPRNVRRSATTGQANDARVDRGLKWTQLVPVPRIAAFVIVD